MRFSITILLVFLGLVSFGLKPLQIIDSLKNELVNNSGEKKIENLIMLSEAYRNINFKDCIDYGMIAIDEAQLLKNKLLEAQILKSLGVSAYYFGDLDKALVYYENSLELSIQIKNYDGMARCYNNIGLVYEEKGEFADASENYKKSLENEILLNNKSGIGVSLISLGNISYYSHDYLSSFDYYYEALTIFTTLEDEMGQANSYNSLGVIYLQWDEFEKAISVFEKAAEFYENNNNDIILSKVYTNLSNVYSIQCRDFKKAHYYINKSMEIKRKYEDKIGIALLNNNLGVLYSEMEDYENALHYYDLSYTIYQEMESVLGLVMVEQNYGKVYLAQNNYLDAISKFTSSLDMASKSGMNDYVFENYEYLMACNAYAKDIKEFEKYYNLYKESNDSIINNLRSKQIINIESKYDITELLLSSKDLKKENDRSLKEVQQLKLIMAGSGGLIILIVFSYVLFLRVNDKKETNFEEY